MSSPTPRWECGTCGASNTGGTATCTACADLVAAGVLTAEQAGKAPVVASAPPPPAWRCVMCDAGNADSAARCTVCAFDRPGTGTPRVAPSASNTWSCVCGKEVADGSAACAACGGWQCAACSLANAPDAAACSLCEAPAPPSAAAAAAPAPPAPAPAAAAAAASGAGGASGASTAAHHGGSSASAAAWLATRSKEAFVVHGPLALPREARLEGERLAAILAVCRADGDGHFADEAFPPTAEALGSEIVARLVQRGMRVGWRRPRDIPAPGPGPDSSALPAGASCGPWVLLAGSKFQALDVQQGWLGNCYVLAALSIVAERDGGAAARLLPSAARSPWGVYQARLCIGGLWRTVTVDDRLPTGPGGRLLFASAARGQLWVSVLEKAMAAVARGGYSGLIGGHIWEGLRLLTGAPVNRLYLHSGETGEEALLRRVQEPDSDTPPLISDSGVRDMLWVRLLSYHQAGFCMGASSGLASHGYGPQLALEGWDAGSTEGIAELGLNVHHAYALTEVLELPAEGALPALRAVRVRDPHGHCAYRGPGHFGDTTVWTASRREAAGVHDAATMQAAGVAILPWRTFLQAFSTVSVARTRSPEAAWSRLAVSMPRPHFSPADVQAVAALGDGDAAVHLWTPIDRVPVLALTAYARCDAELVLSRRSHRFRHAADAVAALAALGGRELTPDELAAAHVDMGAVVLRGALDGSGPLEVAAVLPRTTGQEFATASLFLEGSAAGEAYTVLPLSFGLLSLPGPAGRTEAHGAEVAAAGTAAAGVEEDGAASPGPHPALPPSLVKQPSGYVMAGSGNAVLDEAREMTVELHSAAPVEAAVQFLPLAALRLGVLALLMGKGRPRHPWGLRADGLADVSLYSYYEHDGGFALAAVNRSSSSLVVQLQWAEGECQSAGVVSTRVGGSTNDVLPPGHAQVLLMLTRLNHASVDGWRLSRSQNLALRAPASVAGMLHHVPPVAGTLHEPVPLAKLRW